MNTAQSCVWVCASYGRGNLGLQHLGVLDCKICRYEAVAALKGYGLAVHNVEGNFQLQHVPCIMCLFYSVALL